MKFAFQMCNKYFFLVEGTSQIGHRCPRVLAGNTAKVIPKLKPSGFGAWLFQKLPGEKSKFLRLLFQTAHAGQKNGGRCRDYSSRTGSNQILPKEWLLHPGQKTTAKWFKTTAISLCCHYDDDKSPESNVLAKPVLFWLWSHGLKLFSKDGHIHQHQGRGTLMYLLRDDTIQAITKGMSKFKQYTDRCP